MNRSNEIEDSSVGSLISVSVGVDQTGIRVFEDVGYQTVSALLLFLVILIKFLVMIEKNLLIEQIFQLLSCQVMILKFKIQIVNRLS